MKLKRLVLNNIRSYASGEIIFPEGSTLLSGDIGSGKTTILLGIEFALFGLQPGQRASALLASGENEGEVLLEIELDGEPVIIERTLKRGAKSISHENAFLTYQGVREELSVTELKTRILTLLNYPNEFIKRTNLLYRYTVYSPQEEMKQIILEDAESRLNVIRHIFGIDKYKNIRENLLIITARLREETRMLNAEVKNIDTDKERLKTDHEGTVVLKEKIALQEKIITNKKAQRKAAELEINNLEGKINEKRNFEKEIEKTQVLTSAKSQQYAERMSAIRDLEKRAAVQGEAFEQKKFDDVLLSLKQNELKRGELNKAYIDLSSKGNVIISRKKEQLTKRTKIFDIQICPTCLQDVSDFHKHNVLNEIEASQVELDKELKTLEAELSIIEADKRKTEAEYQSLLSNKSSLEFAKLRDEEAKKSAEQIGALVKTQELLKKDIDFLSNHLITLKQSVLEFTKYENLYRAKEIELRNLFNEEKKTEIVYAELKKEEELVEREIDRLDKVITEKEKVKERIGRMGTIEAWLSGEFLAVLSYTERNIMLKLRDEFSKLFNKWFSILTTDSFYVQLDETFTPIILQGDYELDYAFLSGGERTAVALAYRLALNQVINSIFSTIKTRDMLILDEPTDGFSEQQLDRVRDILHELNVSQLILVSHEQKIEGFVDNIIRVHKEMGKTVVENQKP